MPPEDDPRDDVQPTESEWTEYQQGRCSHLNFDATVNVNRIEKAEGGPVHRFNADVRINCHECGLPFRFIGLPAGMDLNGAAVSIDGQEARLCIAPKGEVMTPLESTECGGFTVRKTL